LPTKIIITTNETLHSTATVGSKIHYKNLFVARSKLLIG